jgi:chloride channel protein, CIC family
LPFKLLGCAKKEMPTTAQSIEPKPTPAWSLVLASLAVGVVAGFGAVLFRALIGGFHNLLFLGRFSFDYDANVHTAASPWGAWVIGVPVLGAVGVAWLVKTFAPEAKGHGVPEVLDAIYYHDGKIRPVVAAVKSLASALSIGSGGSVGREGPIIQIGSTFGSVLGQWLPMPVRQRVILIAAGAGGGIAATFDTPIGGIAFAAELMLVCINPLSLLCVGIACVTATTIGRCYFGIFPSFNVPAIAQMEGPGASLAGFVVFGLLMGGVAWLTTRSIYWFEDLFDRMPGNYYMRHMTGMLLMGLMMYGFMIFSAPVFGQSNHYYIEGVGYATIMDILNGGLTAAGFLLLLGVLKLLATCLTLGSGASGGVFSPCMLIGAALGAGLSSVANSLIPALALNPVHFAVAGMAAMVGGTTGAAITATIMTFEMTRDYTVILPVILTVTLASAVRHWLLPDTIYTLKLQRRGHVVPQGLQAWDGERQSRHVMSPDFQVISESEAGNETLVRSALSRGQVLIVMGTENNVRGVMGPWCSLDTAAPATVTFVTVRPDDRMSEVLRMLHQSGARVALVTENSGPAKRAEVKGIITEREITRLACTSAQFAS